MNIFTNNKIIINGYYKKDFIISNNKLFYFIKKDKIVKMKPPHNELVP